MAAAPRPSIVETLIELEHAGWQALSDGTGAAFYDAHLTNDALMVLPVVGVLDRAASIEAMAAGPPWASFAIEEARLVSLDEANAVLVYRATAQRTGQPRYQALMSTGYTLRADGWRIAFHQQTVADT